MRIVVKRIPIEIIELGIETYAQIDIEEILLTSYPPITKTVLKFYTEYTAFEFQKEYSVKIKNDDAVIKCYVGNTLGTFIQKDAGERTVAEWHKVITRSENHGRDNPLCVEIISHCQKANKMPECNHDFEECKISNPYNYDFNEFKSCNTNQRFHPYYCKKCGILILKKVVNHAREIDKFLWEE